MKAEMTFPHFDLEPHIWQRRETSRCVMHPSECPIQFRYYQCLSCEARRLICDGRDYLITDDEVVPYMENAA